MNNGKPNCFDWSKIYGKSYPEPKKDISIKDVLKNAKKIIVKKKDK